MLSGCPWGYLHLQWGSPFLAGQDATDAFFGLHRHEVLLKPNYSRLKIGTIEGEAEQIKPLQPGELSRVPYAEPAWLTEGFYSPYYKDVRHNTSHQRPSCTNLFSRFVRATAASRKLCDYSSMTSSMKMHRHASLMANLYPNTFLRPWRRCYFCFFVVTDQYLRILGYHGQLVREQEVHAMRLGPGKHLKGRRLFNGAVTPEDVFCPSNSFLQTCV